MNPQPCNFERRLEQLRARKGAAAVRVYLARKAAAKKRLDRLKYAERCILEDYSRPENTVRSKRSRKP